MTFQTLAPDSLSYPAGLFALDPPPTLRIQGQVPQGPAIAIVGTRKCTEAARAFAKDLAAQAVAAGIVVWSGGALGIDTAAHEGALDAGGSTVVVLGGGLSHPSPPENARLFERVRKSSASCLVSREEDDVAAERALFFARNRVLAAACDVLVVVECPLQSGARNAAKHARELGRPVLVLLQGPWVAAARGCFHEYEQLGAKPLRDAAAAIQVVFAERERRFGIARPPPAAPRPAAQLSLLDPELSDDERAVVQAVKAGATDADAIGQRTKIGASRVAVAILELTLRGLLLETHRGIILR